MSHAAKATTALALDAAGTKAGKPIELKKTTLNASADVAMPAAYTDAMKAVRAITIDLAAPFATVKGGGKVNAFNLKGDADLTHMRIVLSLSKASAETVTVGG